LGIVAFLVSWNKLVDAFNAIGQLTRIRTRNQTFSTNETNFDKHHVF
jgi:hypothetical protein